MGIAHGVVLPYSIKQIPLYEYNWKSYQLLSIVQTKTLVVCKWNKHGAIF